MEIMSKKIITDVRVKSIDRNKGHWIFITKWFQAENWTLCQLIVEYCAGYVKILRKTINRTSRSITLEQSDD